MSGALSHPDSCTPFKFEEQSSNYCSQLGPFARTCNPSKGRLTFEDDLRSGGLLCFISMNASIHTELADSMVTLGEPGGGRCRKMATLPAV